MTEHSHRVGAPYRVTSPEATREEGDRLRRSLDGAILVHLRTRKVLDDPHLSAEEKVEKLGGIVGLAGGNAYRTADEEEARALKAVISARDRTIANQAKEIEDLHDQLARVRYELRYDPKISAQSHLNRVRRVAGVSRWS